MTPPSPNGPGCRWRWSWARRRNQQAHHRGGPGHGRRATSIVPDVRTGRASTCHRFAAGDHVWLCGVRIAHTHALEGHSDADVALHALTDALLGAIGGGRYRPALPRHRCTLEGRALAPVPERRPCASCALSGGSIGNVDVTILCEAPRSPPSPGHAPSASPRSWRSMRARVSVKATTTEGLGLHRPARKASPRLQPRNGGSRGGRQPSSPSALACICQQRRGAWRRPRHLPPLPSSATVHRGGMHDALVVACRGCG